jgi:DNA repair protein RecO (recombination protein O)
VRPKKYSSEGIILARKNYSEADRILVVFSKSYGKLHLLAKAVRRPESKKRGALEVFTRIKFSAAKGRGLDIITEAEVIDSFSKIRKDLKRVAVAYFLMEVIGRTVQAGDKNEELYNYVFSKLEELKKATSLKKFREDFVYQVLVLLGYWPEGKPMQDPDSILEVVTERELSSIRIGKRLVS